VSVNRVPQITDSGDCAGSKAPFVGPLTPHLEGFAAHLGDEGYTNSVLHTKCTLARELNRWLARHNFAVVDFDEARLRAFIADRRRRLGGHVRRNDAPTARQLLGYLRSLGCVPGPVPIVDRTALGKLMRDFETFLRSQRGLAPTTVSAYVDCTRRLLAERFRGRALRLQQLRARDIDRFILREARRVSRVSVKKTLAALRCFLRYALQRGAIKTDLAMGLPKVAVWRFSDVPKSLPPDQVERLLGSCDRGTAAGQRNHAILLLLARLGLRAGEVGALTLEDLDWGHGEVLVHAKRQRIQRLPLPKDAGAALAQYLRYARPHCQSRTVFIGQQAPWRGISPSGIGQIVRRALKRAGLKPERTGAHLLRHSLATNMLRKGASLREIGQLLGHDHPTTTQIYAKVDIEALRTIARPWMGRAP
jgi:site-specific recombinase XerD